MQFRVVFRGEVMGQALSLGIRDIGLLGLAKARKATNLPDLSMNRVRGYYPQRREDVRIVLTEEIARMSGHFEAANDITVKVPSASLNRFVSNIPVADQDKETGEVKSVYWKREIDESAVLEAWAEDGFPLEWDPTMADADADDTEE